MATEQTIKQIVNMLFLSPLANKPKPLPGKTEAEAIAATVKIYALVLADIDDDLIRAAVVNHLANEKWFPAVADIRTSAVSLINRASDVPSAYEAWGEVKAFRPTSPLAIRAIDLLGGIDAFRMSELSEESSWRARFIDCYNLLLREQSTEAMTPPAVAGYLEARRELNGSSVSGLIGEAAKMLSMPGKDNDED